MHYLKNNHTIYKYQISPLTPPSKGENPPLSMGGVKSQIKKMYFSPIQILECTTVFLLFKYNILQDMSVVLLSYRNNK